MLNKTSFSLTRDKNIKILLYSLVSHIYDDMMILKTSIASSLVRL